MPKKNFLLKLLTASPVRRKEGPLNIIGDDTYRFDRRIFNTTIVIIVCLLLYVFWTYGFDFSPRIYFKCEPDPMNFGKEGRGCMNPFYKGTLDGFEEGYFVEDKYKDACVWEWCNEKYLPEGFEGGLKPSPLYNKIGPICYTLFALALILNHFLHNRGKLIALGDKFEEDD